MFDLNFLNSGILLAAIATVIPLLIYLFAKKKPRRIVFSSIKFIKESQKQQKKKINLINILLLIIRMLIILLLVIAISRPSIKSEILKNGKLHPPTAVAVIVDNSPSMDYLISTKTNLDKAKEICTSINNILSESDATILLTLDQNWNNLNSIINFGTLNPDEIDEISISNLTENPADIITQAQTMLEESQLINREIYFITDGQKKEIPGNIDLPIYYIFTDKIDQWMNLSCQDAKIINEIVERGMTRKVKFTITNHADFKQQDVLYSLVLNDQVISEKITNLEAGQSKELNFDINLNSEGWQHGYVEVRDERLPWDNRSYFSFYHEKNPKLGIISDQKTLPVTINIIFEIYTGNKNIDIIDPNSVNFESLSHYDFLIIYRGGAFSDRIEFLLDSYLDQDKNILILADSDMDNGWRSWLSKIFSVDFKQFNNDNQSSVSDYINPYHPISSLLDEKRHIDIRDFWEIESKGTTILQSEENALIVEKDHSLLWVFDPSSLKNPLLVDSSYPILLYNSLLYLSGDDLSKKGKTTGDLTNLNNRKIILPGGEAIDWNRNRYTFTESGIYEIDGTPTAVNVDYQESDFHLYPPMDIQNPVFCYDNWEEQILQSRYGFEIWKYLLITVLILFIIEMIIIKHEERKKR